MDGARAAEALITRYGGVPALIETRALIWSLENAREKMEKMMKVAELELSRHGSTTVQEDFAELCKEVAELLKERKKVIEKEVLIWSLEKSKEKMEKLYKLAEQEKTKHVSKQVKEDFDKECEKVAVLLKKRKKRMEKEEQEEEQVEEEVEVEEKEATKKRRKKFRSPCARR